MPGQQTHWHDLPQKEIDYHLRQWRNPYRSTQAFCEFMKDRGLFHTPGMIVDIGCGGGANTAYMAKHFPDCHFLGLDGNSHLIEMGKRESGKQGLSNVSYRTGDLFLLDQFVDMPVLGVVSFQLLSWLPDYQSCLDACVRVAPQWIAASSLFYDGPLECLVHVKDYSQGGQDAQDKHYNIYSIERIRRYFHQSGLPHFDYNPFEIDIDLPPPSNKILQTYTVPLANGKKLQMSGPCLMPWHFIVASTFPLTRETA
jgi:SAM-dependent methyltransferase